MHCCAEGLALQCLSLLVQQFVPLWGYSNVPLQLGLNNCISGAYYCRATVCSTTVTQHAAPSISLTFALNLTHFCPQSHSLLPSISLRFALNLTHFCPRSHSVLPSISLCFALNLTHFCLRSHSVLPSISLCFAFDLTHFCPQSHSLLPSISGELYLLSTKQLFRR